MKRMPALFVVLLLLQSACSSSDSTAPTPEALPSASGTVGPGGGQLSSPDGRLVVDIPAGALGADTELSFRTVDPSSPPAGFDGLELVAWLEMSPAGLDLALPATITLGLGPTGLARSATGHLAWDMVMTARYDDSDGSIEPLEQELRVDFRRGFLEMYFGTDHLDDAAFWKLRGERMAIDLAQVLEEPVLRVGQLLHNEVMVSVPRSALLEEIVHQYETEGTLEPAQDNPVPITEPTVTSADEYDHYSWDLAMVAVAVGLAEYYSYVTFALRLLGLDLWFLPEGFEPTRRYAYAVTFEGYEVIEIDMCIEAPCVGGATPLRIATGLTKLEGITSAYGVAGDPPPLVSTLPVDQRQDPWLYVAGAEGHRYWSLRRNGDGKLERADELGTIFALDALGTLPLSTHWAGRGPATEHQVHALLMYGPGGAFRTMWNPQAEEYGAIVNANGGMIADARAWGDRTLSTGAIYANNSGGSMVGLEYDPQTEIYSGKATYISSGDFPEGSGSAVTGLMWGPSSHALVVTDGAPGQLWLHDRDIATEQATLVGTVGNDPRMARMDGNLVAVSNHASDDIHLFQWGGGASASAVSTLAAGDGPHGIDLLRLSNGNVALVSTGALDASYTLFELSSSGAVLGRTSGPVPDGCIGPRHAAFVGGEVVYIAISCHDSGDIYLLETNYSSVGN